MPLTPRDYQALAEDLLSKANGDGAELRCAASRAYYAGFLTAREWLGVSSEGWNGHNTVLEHLYEREPALAHWLKSAKQCRVKADYKVDVFCTRNEVKSAVTQMNKLITWIEKQSSKASGRQDRH